MTDTTSETISVEAARTAWLEHKHFGSRGCAPHPDNPLRMAGNPDLPVGAHHAPDAFTAETPAERKAREEAAIEVCLNCLVMVACDRYATSVTADGKLAEPDGVWGGRRALERHRALIAARHAVPAAPVERLRTPQRLAVLRALAQCWDPYEVAARAGVDVRTANWQRARLRTQLGLPRKASRAQLLAAARERGLLDGVTVVADDGSVPAVPPQTKTAPETSAVTAVVPSSATSVEAPDTDRSAGPLRVRSPRRDRFADITGQLELPLWGDLAPVHSLFPAKCLEAAA